ncbi:acyl-CoA dehydrogenase family protein [Xanthomonas phaseoli pv. phaseoli]|uniref:glutaryl-CoA dehydrogenase (ETF) n=2 Tax=Xanthomonas campestris pv. phaseoli TaxID=317013 RepID=A0AB38DZN4_XANCH|nr:MULTISPECIES: acyl-CoA dehydrogenase family protein [Xanthomonas]ATS20787.1 acyl-CoA dehydrogenase family protein [Xanthomonas phaseoli pv. phaseoli]ATS27458.1 acyl-CoA dehydrogenase family protein [Xanthomonas phaseoli pv. phaseoli]ATS29120.1 acyl-CoA dehydrogenase family protein [Xanthomonas phaseoli pv. phaseoli]ATS35697.1 acyl-CoA dehydrogenase family protein [Xanthomonas phaseoli pv. phaseoli]MBO9734100.1 acyl-CoA dehydrogenase family protein [Xanthomonas phaseoli pv. phaseoli]
MEANMPVRPDDLFDVRALLTDEERAVQDAVARFTDTRVVPAIGDAFDAGRFPREWIPELAELGLLGASLPVREGGAGLGAVSYGLICQELERGDSGLRSFVSVQSSLCMYPIHAYGSDEQRQRWLPEMAAGRVIGCFGLSEAQGGSDPAAMTTRAVREGDGWRLNGAKLWITNGSIAGLAIIWAHTDDGVCGFLVETDSAGFSAQDISHKMSLRASVTSGLFLDNVFVPEQMRLPRAAGLKAPLSCLNQARYGIAWGAIGAAVACLREALAYAGERILFGRPLAATQSAQIKLADMARRISTAQLLALQLGRLKEAGTLQPEQISLAKWNNCRMALDVARQCRDLLGAAGITTDHVAIRHALNLESVITYEGTETVHQLVVGRALTGLNAF